MVKLGTMTQTYKDLYRRFIDGANDGSHRRVSIESLGGGHTRLVGYDHCVYAERDSDGHITLFEAWADSEKATNASNIQVGYLRQVLDEQPMFHQVAKQTRVDQLKKVDGARYESFKVTAPETVSP